MKISEAILRYRICYVLGYTMWLGTLLMYVASFLTFVYWQGIELGHVLVVGRLFQSMSKIAYTVFEATYPYTSLIWDHAITINQAEPLSYSNLGMVGLLGVALLGIQILRMARSLRSRVKGELQRVEEASWSHQTQGNTTTINAAQIGQVNVHNHSLPPDSKALGWFDRPLVKWALGILASYIVAVLIKLTGVA